MDVNDYIKKQIDNYQIQSDLASVNAKTINETINKFVKRTYLQKNIGKSLINEETRTPKFYLNPKVHKENNPGRPVKNSID